MENEENDEDLYMTAPEAKSIKGFIRKRRKTPSFRAGSVKKNNGSAEEHHKIAEWISKMTSARNEE